MPADKILAQEKSHHEPEVHKLRFVKIQGYRPFKDFTAELDLLEVFVGANGTGKSSFFEFLKFIRDGVKTEEIPAEIIAGSIGQQIFHKPGPDKFFWNLEMNMEGEKTAIQYQGELIGPVGQTRVIYETVQTAKPLGQQYSKPLILMDVRNGSGKIFDPLLKKFKSQEIILKRTNQLALSLMTNPALKTLYDLREFILEWKFYNSFNIDNYKIRQAVPTEQEPILREDAGNLSSVLHYLMTEHPPIFDELQQYLRQVIPGFKKLMVKARGAPGHVIAFWQEEGGEDLSLADLSNGTLHLICWTALCVNPKIPTLICIDEPDQGVHPRTLPFLAGLFKKASERTQIFLATHASYFLIQFDLENLAVLVKENGETKFVKPANSAILKENLKEFGSEEIEIMHKNDELENFSE